MTDLEGLKERAGAAVEAAGRDLDALADLLHANPETGYEERKAAGWLARRLEARGFEVSRGAGGVETAFVAASGPDAPGRPTIAFLAEYDALPKLGHACGHNLIAAMSVGAGLACRELVPPEVARILVVGTPAEEGGGGKVDLLEAGVFDRVDAALMIHPWDRTRAFVPVLGMVSFRVTFRGLSAHAAASPHDGINALDALLLMFEAVALMRQQVTSDARMHGIITRGGDKPNIIPDHTEAEFYVRALDPAYVSDLAERVKGCAEGAARATGCRVSVETTGHRFDPIRENATLSRLFLGNLARLGVEESPRRAETAGSTDFGNVSQRLPGLHGYLAIADFGTPLHSPAFAEAARSPRGKAAMRQGATVLAQTALDLAYDRASLASARAELAA